jgi:hypothetical protein
VENGSTDTTPGPAAAITDTEINALQSRAQCRFAVMVRAATVMSRPRNIQSLVPRRRKMASHIPRGGRVSTMATILVSSTKQLADLNLSTRRTPAGRMKSSS